MPKKLLFASILLLLAIVGVVGQPEAQPASIGLTLADIESLANNESDTEKGDDDTPPSGSENYVPDRSLSVTMKEVRIVCTSDSTITIEGKTYHGEFLKGHTYRVFLKVFRCDIRRPGAWCDKSKAVDRISTIQDLEQGA